MTLNYADPIEVIISACGMLPELQSACDQHISGRHQFGTNWAEDSRGLAIGADGGGAEEYLPIQKIRLECKAYAKNYEDAFAMHRQFREEFDDFTRREIAVAGGTVLLYSVNVTDAPAQMNDPDLNYPFLLWYADMRISSIY